jgi:ABC-type multidrug transport system fused ATPase/permease subunit
MLRSLEKGDTAGSYPWAAIISALGFAQAAVHHVLYFYSMRMGWNWKNACTALIFDALFRLQGTKLKSLKTGKMVNLISNDVSRFEEFAVVSVFLFIILCSILKQWARNSFNAFSGNLLLKW